jgi:uncharacterized membrane-anchored protein
MLQAPALLSALVLASVYAVVFHLWRGRGLRDLVFFWLAAIVGFAAGHLAGHILDINPWTIGQIHIVEATIVAFLFLIMARWLTQEKTDDVTSSKGQGTRDK